MTHLPKRPVFLVTFFLCGIPTLFYALLPPLWVLLVGQFLMGLAAGPINPILMTVEFARIPPEMRARVFGAITAGAFIAMPLGVLGGGLLIDAIGLAPSFLIFGITTLVVTASLFFNPAIHEMDRPIETISPLRADVTDPVTY
jgi:predicted MFS family arabinose efflux permease